MKNIFVVSAKRTAIGSFLGTLKDVSPTELGSIVISSMLEETGVSGNEVNQVVVGNVLSAGQKQGVARQVSIGGGIHESVPAYGLNMVCGSGMKSIMNAYLEIQMGEHIVIAGGVESMSQSPYLIPYSTRSGKKMGNMEVVDHMLNDALIDAFEGYHMGITAENIAEKYNITREEQDVFAYKSQQKAVKALELNRFEEEIVPVHIQTRKGEVIFDKDEFVNEKTTPEVLAKLRPAFKKDGTVTAGNASGINDGASFVMLMDEETMLAKGLTPLAKVVGIGQGGVDPSIMGMGPVEAIRSALKHGELSFDDIDVLELNEAFAAQSLGVVKELASEYSVSEESILSKTNLNGGAIALGHPVGASGNRIVVSLIHEMLRSDVKYGLASLCIGGGMGTAVILEKI